MHRCELQQRKHAHDQRHRQHECHAATAVPPKRHRHDAGDDPRSVASHDHWRVALEVSAIGKREPGHKRSERQQRKPNEANPPRVAGAEDVVDDSRNGRHHKAADRRAGGVGSKHEPQAPLAIGARNTAGDRRCRVG